MTRRILKSVKELGTKKRKDGSKQERLSAEEKADKVARGKKATGRPTFYGGDIWREILSRMASGETLKKICEDDHLPSRREVVRKAAQDRDFGLAYARARLDGADSQFDNLMDDIREAKLRGDPVEATRLKILVDTQKWVLSHVNPRKYADKAGFTLDEGNKPTSIRLVGGKDE